MTHRTLSREPWELAAQPPPPANIGPIVREVLEWAVTIFAVVSIVAAVALLAGPRMLGWQGVIVLSGSMQPELQVGDLVFVDPGTDVASIHEGDVISYRSSQYRGQMVSHRVIEVVRNEGGGLNFRTKGDANEDADAQLVPARDVVGAIRLQVPYLGQVAQKLRNPVVFYMIIGIPAALLIAHEMGNIARQFRRKEAEA
jgi:signal peptidase